MSHPLLRRWGSALSASLIVVGAVSVSTSMPASAAVSAPAIHGVNWGDTRDNFVCGDLLPTGLYSGDSYASVYSKASAIYDGFSTTVGANTVRLPLNIDTVAGSWWNAYVGTIDAARAKGLNVILSEWDGCNSRDGKLDPGWQTMWDKVVARYGSDQQVLFEIMNEPFGYSSSDWLNTAASWISRYPGLPKGRIVVSGPGYNHDAYTAGADSRFNGTLLSVHHYAFWQPAQTYQAWRDQTTALVGAYANRTVFTEFGTFMTTGLNFNNTSDTTNEVAYLRGLTDEFHALGVGSVYWPGLRGGDSYSLTTITGAAANGTGSSIGIQLTNRSALDRLRYGWRVSGSTGGSTGGNTGTSLVGAQSGRCLDDPGGATANGTLIAIWDCSGGSNQRWTYTGSHQLQVLGKCLEALAQRTAPGTTVDLYDCNGGANQQWTFTEGTIVGVQSGLCLDVAGQATAKGSAVDLWTCNGGANQRWTAG